MTTSTPSVRLHTIAIPPEHGAWGFLLEPIVLGLSVAPSAAGGCLALGVVGAFLARHPLKIVMTDRLRGRRYARTRWAARFAGMYVLLAALGLVIAVALSTLRLLAPFGLAAPLGVVLFAGYAQRRGRDLWPELAAANALAATVASLVLAGGGTWVTALTLWAILVARNSPSILYIRARLRLERGQPHGAPVVLLANLVALAGVTALAWAGDGPWLAVVGIAALAARAAHGLSRNRHAVRTQTLGFLEMGYGLLLVALTALGSVQNW